ncbi:MAG: class I SAM-dependent methyltransferase [Ignavibacteriaceae bacterium]|jgi:ubiquinone/menaquinone biosynthesis C-methylase UbiE|nr:class I SAM-dependent methyltransferase [Ignavibacteriaceae bacterium]
MKKKLTAKQIFFGIRQRILSITTFNPYRNLTAWDYQKGLIKETVRSDDIVLDIGSGNNPIERANVLADFSPDDNFHRSGNIKEDRPVIVCSVERIPILTKTIDFALCSHVLEHVNNPKNACCELQRIAHKGYLETPAYGKDILVGTGYMHKWQVVSFENILYFFEYSDREREAFFESSPVIKLWWRKRFHPWQKYFWERQDLFNAWVLWEDKFKCIEHRRKNSEIKKLSEWKRIPDSQLPSVNSSLTENEIKLLEKILATPDGKYSMLFNRGNFIHEASNTVYPVRGKRVYVEMGI